MLEENRLGKLLFDLDKEFNASKCTFIYMTGSKLQSPLVTHFMVNTENK